MTTIGEQQRSHRFPVFLPGGHQFLFYATGDARGIYLGSLDNHETKRVKPNAGTAVGYHPSGWLLFLRESTLQAQRFDPVHAELAGEPVKVADIDSGNPGVFSVSMAGAIAYTTNRPDRRKRSTPSSTEEVLLESNDSSIVPDDWSPDGRFILYFRKDSKGNMDQWVLPVDGDRMPWPFLNNPQFQERHGQFSPDGHWVAYTANQSGRYEIYVASFPAPTQQSQISTNGGIQPRWRRDGTAIYYISPDGKLMTVPVRSKGSTFERDTPMTLFQTRIWGGGVNLENRRQYAVSRDGRFLMNVAMQDTGSPIGIILNWKPPAR